ncbi:NAD(P)/FAD-dependent oxidoreductase [bacterium]|nr:NAD(P)/FAD-dependent oxidoreductase [candidate division CSSED10-310 bacterium]
MIGERLLVVVGAGPAGAAAARSAALHGAPVLVVEARRHCLGPDCCAELAPAMLLSELAVGHPVVIQRVNGLMVHDTGGGCHETKAPGVILDRAVLTGGLLSQAVKAGAEIWRSARLSGLRDGVAVVRAAGREHEVGCGAVIGADGPHSVVAAIVGLPAQRCLPVVQERVVLRRPMEYAHVFFDLSFRLGYGWLFPRGDLANVGLGGEFSSPEKLEAQFRGFRSRLEEDGFIYPDGSLDHCRGWLPVSGPRGTGRLGSVLLVGDAAGHTHPITGAGIMPALLGGAMAGEAAAQMLLSGDEAFLEEYPARWRSRYGDDLDWALSKRWELELNWDRMPGSFKHYWAGFPEYHRGRRWKK